MTPRINSSAGVEPLPSSAADRTAAPRLARPTARSTPAVGTGSRAMRSRLATTSTPAACARATMAGSVTVKGQRPQQSGCPRECPSSSQIRPCDEIGVGRPWRWHSVRRDGHGPIVARRAALRDGGRGARQGPLRADPTDRPPRTLEDRRVRGRQARRHRQAGRRGAQAQGGLRAGRAHAQDGGGRGAQSRRSSVGRRVPRLGRRPARRGRRMDTPRDDHAALGLRTSPQSPCLAQAARAAHALVRARLQRGPAEGDRRRPGATTSAATYTTASTSATPPMRTSSSPRTTRSTAARRSRA